MTNPVESTLGLSLRFLIIVRDAPCADTSTDAAPAAGRRPRCESVGSSRRALRRSGVRVVYNHSGQLYSISTFNRLGCKLLLLHSYGS